MYLHMYLHMYHYVSLCIIMYNHVSLCIYIYICTSIYCNSSFHVYRYMHIGSYFWPFILLLVKDFVDKHCPRGAGHKLRAVVKKMLETARETLAVEVSILIGPVPSGTD